MSIPFMGFLAFIFVGMTMANRILEGVFISSGDVAILNQVTIFTDMSVFGLFSIPVPNWQFLIGLFHLVKMDYSYFGGNSAFILYFLYSLTAAFAAAVFFIIIGLLVNFFNRAR